VYVTVTTAGWDGRPPVARATILVRTTSQEEYMAIRTATAEWKGDLPSGAGTFEGASGQLGGSYSFESRFTDQGGTNPEELVAAAQAACYSMQFAHMLAQAGTKADSIKTDAKVQILKVGEGFGITKIDLVTVGRVPGIDDAAFQSTAQAAKEACLISQALAAVPEITLNATLES
jgi:lipoyl-dependent peroxiredoxin